MRHVVLTEQWFPGIGGSIQLFDALYGHSLPPGDFVHFVAGGGASNADLDASYRWPVTRFDDRRFTWLKPESSLAYAKMFQATLSVCRRERAEVLHCARVIPEAIVGAAVSRVLKIPYTVWVHGEEVSIFMRYAMKKRLMPKIFEGARAVFANSSFTQGRAVLAGAPVKRIAVVNPGVDTARFEGIDPRPVAEKFGLTDKTVLLTVGRLTRRKGHDVGLRALAKLRENGAAKSVRWLILSDGELESELKALCTSLGLDGVVTWVGPVAASELPGFYAAADVFLHPNRTLDDDDVEGFGMVFLEASASGVAVIGGRSGGVIDAVSDGVSGMLVDGTSVDAVAQALERLIEDGDERARYGAGGRAWAKKFSWQGAAHRVRELSMHHGENTTI